MLSNKLLHLRQKERADPLISNFSNRPVTEQFHSNQNSKVAANGQFQTHRLTAKASRHKLLQRLISGQTKRLMRDQMKKSISRKNIMDLNRMRGQVGNALVGPFDSASRERKALATRKKSKTISKLNLAECVRARETQRSSRPRTLRKKSKRNRLKVDLAVLEKNLKSKKFSLSKKCLARLKKSKRFRTTCAGRTQSTRRPLVKSQTKSGKTRISTYLKTERNNPKKRSTPRAKQVDLCQISLKRKKQAKSRRRADNFDQSAPKESFNSLKLLKRSKQLSQEETLLILKSLESEKALRKLRQKGDIFFLKESKLKRRSSKKTTARKSSRRKRLHLDKDIKFGTRKNNILISRIRNKVDFKSDKKVG